MFCDKCKCPSELSTIFIRDMPVVLCVVCQRDYTLTFSFNESYAGLSARKTGLKWLLKAGKTEFYEEFLTVSAQSADRSLQHNFEIQRWLDE